MHSSKGAYKLSSTPLEGSRENEIVDIIFLEDGIWCHRDLYI